MAIQLIVVNNCIAMTIIYIYEINKTNQYFYCFTTTLQISSDNLSLDCV